MTNVSKIERDLMPPPQNQELRVRYAEALELEEGTDDWINFFDFASAYSGSVPDDIMTDEALIEKLQLLFRTARGARLTEKELRALIKAIRKENAK